MTTQDAFPAAREALDGFYSSGRLSFTKAAKLSRALGFRMSRDDCGEIRVGFPGNESAAYYTTDPADALATALDMAERAEAGAVPMSDAEGRAVERGEHVPGEIWTAEDESEALAAEAEDGEAETVSEPVRVTWTPGRFPALSRAVSRAVADGSPVFEEIPPAPAPRRSGACSGALAAVVFAMSPAAYSEADRVVEAVESADWLPESFDGSEAFDALALI